MAFQNAYVSIQIFCFDLRAAIANAAAGKTVRAKDELAATMLGAHRPRRQRGHIKVAVDGAIHGLEAEVSREAANEIQLDVAVNGAEVRVLARIFRKRDLHSS